MSRGKVGCGGLLLFSDMTSETGNYESWAVEQVWGDADFYSKGDVAGGEIAFVIDSGVTLLDDLNVNQEWSKDFTDGGSPFKDGTGHGTAVASLIGAKANGEGLTGVAPGAQIVSLKVFGDSGFTSSNKVTQALSYARDVIVENNLFDKAVVNLSLGRLEGDKHPLVQEMADLGIKFSIAAGNSAVDVDKYSPASYGHHENVYTVVANTRNGKYASFTNYETADPDGVDDADFSAPGLAVPVYDQDGNIVFKNGTSFSAPLVGGLLLMSEDIAGGETFELSDAMRNGGGTKEALALFDENTYKHGEPVGTKVLWGDHGENLLEGGRGRDIIKALRGDDILIGNAGNDVLQGGRGEDFLDAGTGADFMTGGKGLNVFADQADGDSDLLLIRLDADASQADRITELDEHDVIFLDKTSIEDISLGYVDEGIGIYGKGHLEAIYLGGDLGIGDLEHMINGLI